MNNGLVPVSVPYVDVGITVQNPVQLIRDICSVKFLEQLIMLPEVYFLI